MRLDHYLLYHMNKRWTMKQTQHSAVMEQIRDSCGISKVYKKFLQIFCEEITLLTEKLTYSKQGSK